MTHFRLGFSLAIIGLAASCATTDVEDQQDPLMDPRVGEKVDRICFANGVSGFREWDGSNGLILRRGVRNEFLVTFIGSCPPADNAMRIGVDERFGGGCLGRGDGVFVSSTMFSGPGDSPFDNQRCRVAAIYEWDEDAEETSDSADTE